MKYSGSINSLLNYFRDTSFWQLNLYSNELKEYRQDISGQWDDHAAREINHRYLIPHEEDKAEMQNWFEKQHQAIQQLTIKLDEVETININILLISSEIRKLSANCEEDLRKAITNFDFSFNSKNDAESLLPDITRLLNSANRREYSVNY